MPAIWSTMFVTLLVAQRGLAPGVENRIEPKLTIIEQQIPNTWIMDEVVFIKPRMITVDVPGKGRRLLWYLIYRVTNRSDTPRMFVPDLVLVDDKGRAYRDVIIPKAQQLIQTREDPLRPLENTVTIAGPIQPSTEEGVENAAYGVAIWDGVDPQTDSFSIFIGGLSNGFKVLEANGQNGAAAGNGQERVLRKTLELKFARPGDEFNQNEREIRYLGHDWVYR